MLVKFSWCVLDSCCLLWFIFLPHIWMDVQFTAQASGLRRPPLVIVYSSVMTMYCIAKTPSSALFTPGLLGGERERREIAKWAMMGRKVCGRKWEKESARQRECQWHFSSALFTSRMKEVKRAAGEGEGEEGRAMKRGWKRKYEVMERETRKKMEVKGKGKEERSVWMVMGVF